MSISDGWRRVRSRPEGVVDLGKIRQQVEDEQGPEWTEKYGRASWDAAMALIGEPLSESSTPVEPCSVKPSEGDVVATMIGHAPPTKRRHGRSATS